MYAGHFDFTQRLLWTVPALYSAEECSAMLRLAEGCEWLSATVNSESGRIVDATIRDNTVAVIRDPSLSEGLYERVRPHVPERMSNESMPNASVVGVNVPARIYRYQAGQHFGLHNDQFYFGPNETRSFLTLMVYLNDDFEGGETEFPEQNQLITPRTGTALLFQHMVLHAGRRVVRGTKYVLRSDVMYRAQI